MASAAVQSAPGHTFDSVISTLAQEAKSIKHDVVTELNYYKDPEDGSGPPAYHVGKPNQESRPHDTVKATIRDISGDEDKYTLDSHGFQILKHESKEKDFLNEEKIKAEYYPEIEQLLKDTTGATRVFIFDHTIRRAVIDSREPNSNVRGPGKRVHIDQSYSASVNRVEYHLPNEANTLLKNRFQIINVWRPIKPIFRDPLGVSDAFSVPESDLVPTALIYPDRKGETFAVRANERHKWYFKFKQSPSEPLLIKCFDSKKGVAKRVPHSAFEDGEFVGEEPRESIEVRTLVFYDS